MEVGWEGNWMLCLKTEEFQKASLELLITRPSNELWPWIIFPACHLSFALTFLDFPLPWESPLKILLYFAMYYLFSKCILMVLVQVPCGPVPRCYLVTKQQQQQPGCVT